MKDQAMKLVQHWGLKYQQTMFQWRKVRDGKPQTLPGTYSDTSCEELWVCTKGSPKGFLNDKTRISQYVEAPATKHSSKP